MRLGQVHMYIIIRVAYRLLDMDMALIPLGYVFIVKFGYILHQILVLDTYVPTQTRKMAQPSNSSIPTSCELADHG